MAFYETPNTQIQSPSHYCYTIPAFMAGDFGAWAWEAYPSRKFAGHGSYVIQTPRVKSGSALEQDPCSQPIPILISYRDRDLPCNYALLLL